MMEAARTSETLVNFYQTTRRYNPEDSQHHQIQLFTYCVPKKAAKNAQPLHIKPEDGNCNVCRNG
jgi:hypothetical protein